MVVILREQGKGTAIAANLPCWPRSINTSNFTNSQGLFSPLSWLSPQGTIPTNRPLRVFEEEANAKHVRLDSACETSEALHDLILDEELILVSRGQSPLIAPLCLMAPSASWVPSW